MLGAAMLGAAGLQLQYLEDALVVDLVEHRAVDLVGFQRHPVEDGHAELGLDGLLDLHSWGQHKNPEGQPGAPEQLPAAIQHWALLRIPLAVLQSCQHQPQRPESSPKGNLGFLQHHELPTSI